MKRIIVLILFIIGININLCAQEALKSTEEDYYDFLSLQGLVERPSLGYRTLSDSVWAIEDDTEHIWNGNNLGTTKILWENSNAADNWFANGIFQGVKYKIFGPEWFNSYNTAAPYGQNDGALWQGKGYNTALTGGVRVEGYGFEITFKPQVSFTQNQAFDYMTPIYSGDYYKNKAEKFGDYSLGSIDAPQRFGDKAFWNFDLGDTEIRWSWNTFTIGFGTENIWLGPAQINPIMHSNNGPGYPHLDFGIRKQNISFKDIDLGDIEFRYWLGKTSESQYFDNDSKNNNNLITGISLSYRIPFFDGLRIGLNRTMLSKWDNINSYTLFTLLIPMMKKKAGYDESDQRATIFAEYYIPKGGIDLYLEWGRNDYNTGIDNLIRYPFHTQGLTAGFKKSINYKTNQNLSSQFLFELTYLQSSMDYHFFYDWGGIGNDFYTHHKVTQGYTNKGQYLGAGIGAGGNSQFVSYKLFYPKGSSELFIYRINPDLNYSYFLAPRDYSVAKPNDYVKASIRVIVNIGLSSQYYFSDSLSLNGAFIFSDEHNPLNFNSNLYKVNRSEDSVHRYNFVTNLSLKYNF